MFTQVQFLSALAIICAVRARKLGVASGSSRRPSVSASTMSTTGSPSPPGSLDGEVEASLVANPLFENPFASEQDQTWQSGGVLFDLTQFLSAFVQLWMIVAILVRQLCNVAKDVVRLQDRVSQIEQGRQSCRSDGDERHTEFHKQVRDLCATVQIQQGQICKLQLELEQRREEVDQCQSQLRKLTTTFNEDAKKLNEFTSGLETTLIDYLREQKRHDEELAKIRKEMAHKYAVTNAGFAAIQTQLASSMATHVPTDVFEAGQAARDARRKRILASVARRMEGKDLRHEIEEALSPIPAVRASMKEKENIPATFPAQTNKLKTSASPTSVAQTKEQLQIDSAETVQPGAGQSTSNEEPQVISAQTVQPGAVPSARASKPRQSRLPIPRKSLLPVASSRVPLSNMSNVGTSVERASTQSEVQTQEVPTVTVTPPVLESTGRLGCSEGSPVQADSPPVAVDAAMMERDSNLLDVSAAVDSISLLDGSFSTVPRIPKPAKSPYKADSLYTQPTRNPVVARLTRSRWL